MIPEHLKIGYEVYCVSLGTKDFELQGECDTDQATIILTPNGGPRRRMATLVHEILHACWDQAEMGDLGDDAREEQIVNRISTVLAQTLMDNQALLRCLEAAGQTANSTCYGAGGIDRGAAKLWVNKDYNGIDNEQSSEQKCVVCGRATPCSGGLCYMRSWP